MEAPVFKIEYEYITPTNIESEVPGIHEMREGKPEMDTPNSTPTLDNKVENEDYTLSPVITVTKQESAFTKGDLKLQKVSVTENISESEVINGLILHPFNSNPNIHSAVIKDQPIRVPEDRNGRTDEVGKLRLPEHKKTGKFDEVSKVRVPKDRTGKTDEDGEIGIPPEDRKTGKADEDAKAKTRIPTLKFKQAAQTVRERRGSGDKREEVPPPRLMQKRSSIPRLKDSRIPPPLDRRASKPDVKDTPEPEDEFEKIYDEIIVSEPKEIVIETIDSIKVEDPEKLDNKFEEIIHDYEENKVHPITEDIPIIVEKPKSKIPLSKRKSEQEIKIPKPVDRTTIKNGDTKPEKTILDSRIPMHKDVPHKTIRTKYNIPRIDDKSNEVASNKIVITKQISVEKPKEVELKSTLISIEPVKVVQRDVIEEKMKESVLKDLSKPDLKQDYNGKNNPKIINIDVSTLIPDVRSELKLQEPLIEKIESNLNKANSESNISNENNNNEVDKVNKMKPEHGKENNIDSKEDRDIMDREYKPGKVSRLLQRIRSKEFGTNDSELKKEIPVDVPKKRSVLSKIAMFERQESDEIPTTKQPKPNKQNRKPNEMQVETMKEEVIDRKPVIVDELLKHENIVDELSVKPSLSEEGTNKNYGKEICDNTVKYQEVQVINPVQEIKIESPITNGQIVFDKPIFEVTPKHEDRMRKDFNDEMPKKLINKSKLEPYNTPKREEIAKPLTKEFLQPPTENIDEKVPREIVIETLEYRPTEYEIKVQNCVEENLPVINQNNYPNKNKYEPYDTNNKEAIPIQSIKLQETKIETFEFEPTKHLDEVENADEVFSKESKAEAWRRHHENGGTLKERPKSVAEIDLGDAVKGKVHKMIVRMNSFDKSENNKKVIDVRERPRKKSVSKIIAMFEQRSIQLDPPTTNKPDVTTNLPPPPQTISDEEYHRRTAELVNGKLVYGRVENMTYMVLNNGVEMPVLAVGTALLDNRLIRPIIEAAIDMGYRAIDTAYIYGNEKEIGDAIRAKIDDGTVTREDLFIISKLWSTFHRSDLVSKACQASLRAMGLDYFDLYLIHNPVSFKEGNDPIPKIANVVQYSSSDYMDAWFGMEGLVSKGLVRSIGVSNFNSRQIQTVVEKARVKPVINQVECHPYLSQERLDDFCSARDVKLSCFGVLGSKGTPSEYKSGLPPVIDDPLVQVVAAGLNITPAQLLIRYQIDSGHQVVVKASSAAHLWDNLQALQVSLEPAQVEALHALNRNKRTFTFVGIGDTHRNYPFKIPF